VQQATTTSTGYSVTIKNIGGFPAPADIMVNYTDGTTATYHQSPAIWSSNQKEAVVNIKTKKKIKSLKLEGGIFMDANEADNTWTAK